MSEEEILGVRDPDSCRAYSETDRAVIRMVDELVEKSDSAERVRTRLKAGTVLVRQWHGVTHRVTVVDDGFDFDGERFRSLSEMARKITGVRWSDPLFFGLKSSTKEQGHGAE